MQHPLSHRIAAILPRDLPMPTSGTILDDVLCLFEPDPYLRQDLILGDKGCHDLLVEAGDSNPFLPPGWLLFSDDKHALFRVMTRWEVNGWQPVKPRGDLFWRLEGMPDGLFPDIRLLEGFFAGNPSPAQIRSVFLEHYVQAWVGTESDIGCNLTPVAEAVQWILDARSRSRQTARRLGTELGIAVPADLSPRDLDAWVIERTPASQAIRVGSLLGLAIPGEREALHDWLDEWRHLAEPLELAGLEPMDMAKLKQAWLAEARDRA